MSRRNLRQVPRINYYEPEEPSWDEYIYCNECCDYVFEYCSMHGDLLVIPDDKVPTKTNFPSYVPRAALTIPHVFLHLAPSIIPGAGLGVYATLTLPRGVRFGPYCGQRTHDIDSMYGWQLYDRDNKPSHVVDAADAARSNWMRYVNCARHWCEQNLVAYQYRGQLYYRTIKIIPRFTELMVFYGGEFAYRLGVDLGRYNSPLPRVQRSGAPGVKKPNTKNENAIEKGKSEARKPKCKLVSNDKMKINKENNSDHNNNVQKYNHIVTNDVIKDCLKYKSNINLEEQNVSQQQVIKKSILSETDGRSNIVKDTDIKICSRTEQRHVCEICHKSFSTKAYLIIHSHTHTSGKLYTCKDCEKSFNQKSDLTKHIRIHTGEKPYTCNECHKCFNQKDHLTRHIRTHTGEKPYTCNECDNSFTEKGALTRHIRTHTGEKPYSCDGCEKSFKQKSNLTTHIRTHTGVKPYTCDNCQKSFSVKGALTKHIRIHTGEKPYTCNECDNSFTEKGALTKHIRTHTGEKPYTCNECDNSFTEKGALTKHIRTHTGEKPYSCNGCEKSFKQKSDLTRHFRTHTGVKPYTCDNCQKSFSVKGALTKHIRTHTGEKPYTCNECDNSFTEKGALTKHIRTHTGEKPYKCDICNMKFKHSNTAKAHLKIHM